MVKVVRGVGGMCRVLPELDLRLLGDLLGDLLERAEREEGDDGGVLGVVPNDFFI